MPGLRGSVQCRIVNCVEHFHLALGASGRRSLPICMLKTHSIYRLIEDTGLDVSPARLCMKILIYSDLHTEFRPFTPSSTDADLVILAGDIGTKARGVTWANEAFNCPVVYVCGNHEFYGGHIDRTLAKMKATAAPHVHVLEDEVLEFGRVRFLCATSWTDFSSTGSQHVAAHTAWTRMSDFNAIRADSTYRRLRPQDVIDRNRASHAWLSQELDKPYEGKTVVITHHAPVMSVVKGAREHLTAAYANHWPQLVGKADFWIYGHLHRSMDMHLGRCRLLSNPRGYPGEHETGFRPDFEIELP